MKINGDITKSRAIRRTDQGKVRVMEFAITASAVAPGLAIPVPDNIKIVDMDALCTTANASGSAKLTDGTNDITNAATMAVLNIKTKITTLVNGYRNINKNGTLKVVCNGAADRGIVFIYYTKR